MGYPQPENSVAKSTTYQVKAFAPDALGYELRQLWDKMRAQNPTLYSPYFTLGYIDAVHHACGDVRILVISKKDDVLGFLAVQGKSLIRPAGMPLSDYQGIICRPDTELDLNDVLRSGDLGAFHYGLMVNDFVPGAIDDCACIDLSGGGQAWRDAQNKSYRRNIKDLDRRNRRAEEEIGEITIEYRSDDEDAFEQLLTWKREKFAVTHKYDVLSVEWTNALLRELWQNPPADVRADMHVMRYNGAIAAIDLGLTDGKTYHSWIVGYDVVFSRYSPGACLLEDIITRSADLGYTRLDLGNGIEGYKKYYHGMPVTIRSGMAAGSGPLATLSRLYRSAEQSPLKPMPTKLRRRYSQIAACDSTFGGRSKAMLSAIKNAGK